MTRSAYPLTEPMRSMRRLAAAALASLALCTGATSTALAETPALSPSADPAGPALLLMHEAAPSVAARIQHGNGLSRVVLRVPDVNAVAARLTALGYSHDGVTSGYHITKATDPEGCTLELVQPPASK